MCFFLLARASPAHSILDFYHRNNVVAGLYYEAPLFVIFSASVSLHLCEIQIFYSTLQFISFPWSEARFHIPCNASKNVRLISIQPSNGSIAQIGPWPPPLRFLDHTHSRTPLDEWSARHRGLYLHRTTQHINTRDKQPCLERHSNPRSQ
jgi:hypothetical protein